MSRKPEVDIGIRKEQWCRNTEEEWRTSSLFLGTKVAGVRKRASEEATPQGITSFQLKQKSTENRAYRGFYFFF